MPQPKEGTSTAGILMHYSVGAVIKKDNRYLLIDRVVFPLGFAGLAGHIDRNETPEGALVREVKEESGLDVQKSTLLFEEELGWNTCSYGITTHYWHLFKCDTSGSLTRDTHEAKSIGWYTASEILSLKLEPVWEYWFKKLGII
jgi:8-oxo-dGTP pyrophosphatase MutT (NUDIX family)